MHTLVESLIRYGLPLIFANVLVEQLGLPLPAFPTLVAAGALSAEGRISAAAALGVALAASLAADTVWFLLGRRYGYRVLRLVCGISLSPDSCVRQTETLFERHGLRSLLVAKFVPGLSTVAPPLAGAVGSRYRAFALFDLGGALVWAGGGVAVGRLFHRAIDRIAELIAGTGFWALVIAAGGLALFIFLKWWERRSFFRQLRMARISVEELARLLEKEEGPIVVDVRSRAATERDPRRIPGAVRILVEELAEGASALPRDREIVLYCT